MVAGLGSSLNRRRMDGWLEGSTFSSCNTLEKKKCYRTTITQNLKIYHHKQKNRKHFACSVSANLLESDRPPQPVVQKCGLRRLRVPSIILLPPHPLSTCKFTQFSSVKFHQVPSRLPSGFCLKSCQGKLQALLAATNNE